MNSEAFCIEWNKKTVGKEVKWWKPIFFMKSKNKENGPREEDNLMGFFICCAF